MKIISATLRNDTWTNGLYKIDIVVDELPKTTEQALFEDETSLLVYGENEAGFVTYGSISKKASFGHQPGYRWSSRASLFNGMFGKKCMEVTIIYDNRRYTGNMNIDKVLQYLPANFYLIEQVETNERGEVEEITYYITEEEHERKNQWHFSDVEYDGGAKRYISRRIRKEG